MSLTAPLRLRVEKPKIRLRVLPKLIPLDGKSVEMQTTADYIQWRLVGDTAWTNLIALSEIAGPKGDDGSPGPANSLSIGAVDSGTEAAATITGDAPSQTLNLTLPKGDKGDKGDTGSPGTDGTDGLGVPAGGTEGQVLSKASATDNDTEWIDPPASGVTAIMAGAGISVDSTDPANPKVTALVRELLTANRTYYVATTGSDSNDGLTSGTAFATIQKAMDVAATIDFSGFKVTTSVGAGTFSGKVTIPLMVGQTGSSMLEIVGAGATTIISYSGSYADSTIYCGVPGAGATISNAKIENLAGGSTGCAVNAENSGQIILGSGIEIGTAGWNAARAATNGVLKFTAGATFSANAGIIFSAQFGGYVEIVGTFALGTRTVTTTASASATGLIFCPGGTSFTGTVTGTRYSAITNGVITTSGGGESFFPGTVAGTKATGGQYV